MLKVKKLLPVPKIQDDLRTYAVPPALKLLTKISIKQILLA
jgi:hypothetical protein